jgi:hypothetical protein
MERNILLATGFEKAFLGIATDFAGHDRAVYDYDKCVDVLMKRDHMTLDDACEYMDFNVVGAWVGEGTPIFMQRMRYRSLIAATE